MVDVSGIDPQALRRAMDMAGMSPAQLAERLGVTTSYVARITKGDRRLKRNPGLCRRIADELDVPMHWITVRDGAA